MFWEKYVELCASAGKTPNAVAKEIEISSGTVSFWKKGKQPQALTLAKVANYFNVPVEYFSEETKKDPSQMAEVEVDSELAEMWKSADANERKAIIDAAKLIMGLRGK